MVDVVGVLGVLGVAFHDSVLVGSLTRGKLIGVGPEDTGLLWQHHYLYMVQY